MNGSCASVKRYWVNKNYFIHKQSITEPINILVCLYTVCCVFVYVYIGKLYEHLIINLKKTNSTNDGTLFTGNLVTLCTCGVCNGVVRTILFLLNL